MGQEVKTQRLLGVVALVCIGMLVISMPSGLMPRSSLKVALSGPSPDIIVTGGAGFIGSTFVKEFRRRNPDKRIVVVDNLWRGKLSNLQNEDGSYPIDMNRDFINADLTVPSEAMESIMQADTVYHLADVVASVDFVFSHEAFVFRQNVLINSNVLAAAVSNHVKNLIYVGTACSFRKDLQGRGAPVNKDGVVALHENTTYPALPESSYGWSKLMGEYEAEKNMDKTGAGMSVGLLRLHNVYGPFATYDCASSQAIPSLIRKAILSPLEDYKIWGSGEQYRDFMYVDDVVDALFLMREKGMNKGVMQVGTARAAKLKDVAIMVKEIAKRELGKELNPVFDKSKMEGDFGRIAVLDLAKKEIGYSPKVTLEQGIARTMRWMQKHIKEHPPVGCTFEPEDAVSAAKKLDGFVQKRSQEVRAKRRGRGRHH